MEAHSVDRALFAGRQKFSVSRDKNGGSVISLNEADRIRISAGDEGVSIEVAPVPEPNGNGVDVELEVQQRRSLYAPQSGVTVPGCAIDCWSASTSMAPSRSTRAIRRIDPSCSAILRGNVLTVGEVPMPAE